MVELMQINSETILFFLVYYAVIAAISVAITVCDKSAAKKGAWRISEFTLMMFGFAGGALPMFITMKKIRHKTKHMKFMIGLPAEMLLHVLIIAGIAYMNLS